MSKVLQIESLTFRKGTDYETGDAIATSSVIVFVGPNNSGKSLALSEIESSCVERNGYTRPNPSLQQITKIVGKVGLHMPHNLYKATDLLEALGAIRQSSATNISETQSPSDEYVLPAQGFFKTDPLSLNPGRVSIKIEELQKAISAKDSDFLRSRLLRFFVVRLDGLTRFALSAPTPSGDLQGVPLNHLWALFTNDAARKRVRQLTEEEFGLHFVIDATAMTQFRPRLSEAAPSSNIEEQSLGHVSRQFHSSAKQISDFGDGVKAFVGLVSAVLCLPHKIILIDEPEAFLYPPLARRLGRNLAKIASERGSSLVTATHSADFLFGCMETTPDTTIIRLTYENGVGSARFLLPAQIKTLMLDPLLRSTNALRGLFHRAVVVTESDTDRAFYDEINRRLQDNGRGIDDPLFANAQNWQTVARVVGPLRSLGVLAVAIIDLDAVSEKNGWENIYEAFNIDAATRTSFEQSRARCESFLKALPLLPDSRKAFKVRGIDALNGAERTELESLITAFANYGLFIVPVGEVEQWLQYLNPKSGRKNEWLVNIFESLGSDPSVSSYAHPIARDVWDFLDTVAKWIAKPQRNGMSL